MYMLHARKTLGIIENSLKDFLCSKPKKITNIDRQNVCKNENKIKMKQTQNNITRHLYAILLLFRVSVRLFYVATTRMEIIKKKTLSTSTSKIKN